MENFDDELYKYGKQDLVDYIERVRVRTISAIVVGITFETFPKRKAKLFISNGLHSRDYWMENSEKFPKRKGKLFISNGLHPCDCWMKNSYVGQFKKYSRN